MSLFKKLSAWWHCDFQEITSYSFNLIRGRALDSPGTFGPAQLVFVYTGPEKRARDIQAKIESIVNNLNP